MYTNSQFQEWRQKLVSIEEALAQIPKRSRIVTAMAAAEPQLFFRHVHDYLDSVQELTLYCANPSQQYPIFENPDYGEKLRINVMFLTAAISRCLGKGYIQYVPQHLSQWARHLVDTHQRLDVFWGSCSVPDPRGFVSLGTGTCYESEALRKADLVVLEINPNMPVTYGSTTIRLDSVDYFVESTFPLPSLERKIASQEDTIVANHVAELIEDNSTLQLGIGGIPDALTKALESKRDLGIHTELINDSMMELFHKGVITGKAKSIWPGKIVGAFVFGSRALYDFVHHNPFIELQPASVVNDPYRIGRNYRMVSINTAVEIDITGQVCSESVGHREISGVGGASDTHVGAQRSEGGRGIIAMRSTTPDGSRSKIVFELQPGAKISISRNDIDTVVTEFGVAELAGKSVLERAHALIRLTHPRFRDELTRAARNANYI